MSDLRSAQDDGLYALRVVTGRRKCRLMVCNCYHSDSGSCHCISDWIDVMGVSVDDRLIAEASVLLTVDQEALYCAEDDL